MHGELGNRFYLLFCDDREKKTNGKHERPKGKTRRKMRARKMRSFARTRRRVSRSTVRISRKISIPRRARRVAARVPVLSRHLSRARCIIRHFHNIKKPSPFSTRRAYVEKRTRSFSRTSLDTDSSTNSGRSRNSTFSLFFTHGAMMMIRSRGALLVAF